MKIAPFLAAGLLTLTALAQQPRPTAPLPPGATAHRDLAYVENGHERQKLDLYLPAKTEGPVPLLIWVHGGGWSAGSKEQCPPLRQGYLDRGYAVASLGYRLSSHAIFPAQIQDCKAAIRWLRAHAKEYGLNGDRFGVWGSSAGGHLVALLGTSGGEKTFEEGANPDISSRIQAVCDFYGPTDFEQFVATPGFASHATATSPEARLFGGAVTERKELAARANPITFVDKTDPPFLIVHGDKDSTVPINQSQSLYQALTKAGVSAHLHTIHGAGHGNGFSGKNIDDLVNGFFEARLKKGSTDIVALSTESEASAAPAASRPGAAGPSPQQRMIPWELIAGRHDKNQDGKITREEFSGPAPLFERIDQNRDGVITKEEHATLAASRSNPAPAPGASPAPAEKENPKPAPSNP